MSYAVVLLAIALLGGCNKDDSTIPDGQGKVTVKLTDAPFPFGFVSEANIGVAKVEVKTANGEYVTLFEGSASYNMVDLTNGATVDLETTNIDAGTYVEARITLDNASVKLANGMEFDLSSFVTGKTTTVSIEPALVVEKGTNSEVLFDFEVSNSFSFLQDGGIMFPGSIPAISSIKDCTFDAMFRVCDLNRTGEISGTVTVKGSKKEHVQVSVTVNGKHLYSFTKADGTFKFIGIAPGNYTVTAETEDGDNEATVSVTVNVAETASCSVDIN